MLLDTGKLLKVTHPREQVAGQNWHYLMKLQNNAGGAMNIEPTLESRGEGKKLAWLVPDNAFNRTYISAHINDHDVEEVTGAVTKPAAVPTPVEKTAEKTKDSSSERRMNPMEIKELKSKITEELDANGVRYSKTATLKDLQKVLDKYKASKSEA